MNILVIKALLEANTLFHNYGVWELSSALTVSDELADILHRAAKSATPEELVEISALCALHNIDFDAMKSEIEEL